MKKIILDTDIGNDIDDALCLTYLLCQKQCDLLGITTVSDSPADRCELASAICTYNNRSEVPIFAGKNEPLLIDAVQGYPIQHEEISGFEYKKDFKPLCAIDFLRDTIRANPHEITLLAIGPLTNIGALFSAYPDVAELLDELVIMGGHFFDPIDGTMHNEWNIKCDPHAAQIVADSKVKKIRWIGLDVTMKVRMERKEAEKKLSAKPLVPAMAFAKAWFRVCGDYMIFHDPLAGVSIFDKSVCTWKYGDVRFETAGGKYSGASYFTAKSDGKHEIAVSVNTDKFFEHYLEVIENA